LTDGRAAFALTDDELVDVGAKMREDETHRQERGSDGEYERCSEDHENHGGVHDFSSAYKWMALRAVQFETGHLA
jgi:hypothetical protein